MDKRDLANEARKLTLQECIKHLKKGKGKMYEAVLLRLAGGVLPRLNEHTGEGGGPMQVIVPQVVADAYDIPINKASRRGNSEQGEV